MQKTPTFHQRRREIRRVGKTCSWCNSCAYLKLGSEIQFWLIRHQVIKSKQETSIDVKNRYHRTKPFNQLRSFTSLQTFPTHTIKFVSFHLPQMKFTSTRFSYQCRVWNQVCIIKIHIDISQRIFCSTFPSKKKRTTTKEHVGLHRYNLWFEFKWKFWNSEH